MTTRDSSELNPLAWSPDTGGGDSTLPAALRLHLSLLDSVPGCLALILRRGTHQIVAFNELAQEAGAGPGLTCYETVAQREDPCPFCRAPELWGTGQPQQVEVEYRDRWYHRIWAPLSEELYMHYIFDITERKSLENGLRVSERRLSSIYNATSDAIFQLAVEPDGEYRFTSVNSAFCNITGLPPEAVVGRRINEVIPQPSLALVLEKYQQAILQRSVMRWEEVSDYPTGRLTGDVSVAPMFDPQGRCTHLVGTVRDITEYKRAEEALRDTQALFSSFLRYSPVHTYIKEVTPTESRTLQASDNFFQMVGIPAQELLGRPMEQIFPPEFAAKISADDWAVVSGGTVLRLDEELNGLSYTTIKFPIALGDKTLLGGYTIDITDRKRAEEARAESERRLATLMANLPGMAYRCRNNRDWTMLFASEGCEELTGYTADDLLGNSRVSYADLIHPDDREQAWQTVQDRLAAGEPFHLLYRIVTAGENIKWVWERGRGVFDENGTLLFLEGFITDVSERVRAERTLKERDDQLRQSQKMEAIGQLAGGIAHDFNNLLAIILGYSDILLAGDEPTDPADRKKLQEIRRAAERAAALTNQILAFSRRQPLRPRVVSLNDVVTGMEPLLRRTLGEDLEFVTHLEPNLGPVEADVNQFEQVLMNLAVNARDAMSPGDRLTIETANVDMDEEGHHVDTGSAAGSHVLLTVVDTGAGMNEETRQRAFEPFFTTKPAGSGTGLGLSTVYGIVTQSKGAIYVDSEPGRGTAFRIYLPKAVVPAQMETPAADDTPRAKGHETVLLVEDEESLRALMEEVLSRFGYAVLSSGTAAGALQLVQGDGRRPDILVTDVVLPGGMQGDELAKRLTTLLPGLPVLFVSGYSRDAIVHEGRLDPSVNLLQKPFAPQLLAETVRTVLNRVRS